MQQSEGLGAGQRLRVECEPVGLLSYTEYRLTVLQHGAERLQERAELSGRQTQPDRSNSDVSDQTIVNFYSMASQSVPSVMFESIG